MIDSILSQLKDQVSGELKTKGGLKDEEVNQVMNVFGDAASQEVGQKLKSGDISTLMNLFSHQSNNSQANSLQNSISQTVIQQLTSRLGMEKGQATMITNLVLPQLMNLISNKNEQTPANDSSPILDMFGDVLGGGSSKKGGGLLGGLAGKLFGK